jgi:hypothetical protein
MPRDRWQATKNVCPSAGASPSFATYDLGHGQRTVAVFAPVAVARTIVT